MKTLTNMMSGITFFAACAISGQAFATPVEYPIVQAIGTDNSVTRYPSVHALWLPSFGDPYQFDLSGTGTGEGLLTIDDMTGEASITGTVWLNGDSTSPGARGWEINFNYTGGTTLNDSVTPKLELRSNQYVTGGGIVDPSTWYYLTATTGTLTGVGGNTGTLTVTDRGEPALQVGIGANGKNINFGASGWITACGSANGNDSRCYYGDINVPEPTSLALLSIGLLGFSAARRMRKQ